MEGRASRRRGRRVREHQRRSQGGSRSVLHLGQRGADRGVHPGGPGGALPARPIPRRLRTAGDRPGQHAYLDGRVPRARRDQPGRAEPQGQRRRAGGAVHPSRMRLLDRRAVAGRGGRPAARPDPDSVHRRHARRRPQHQGPHRARGHRNRHAAPVAQGQSGRALGGGQPGRCVPVHEDDDPGVPAALPARGNRGSDRRPRRGRPSPPGGAGDDRGRRALGGCAGSPGMVAE